MSFSRRRVGALVRKELRDYRERLVTGTRS
jgi:hypothetical protein